MNRTSKAEREQWILFAYYSMEHADPLEPWRVTNRQAVQESLMLRFGVSLHSAKTALFRASTRYNTELKRKSDEAKHVPAVR